MRCACCLLFVISLVASAHAQVTMLDSGGNQLVGQRTSVTIGGDGLPLIAYENSASRTIEIAHCLEVDCTRGELSSPFAANEVLYGPGAGLATGANGLGVLTWHKYGVGLRIGFCADARCSTASVKTLDPFTYDPGMTGQRASIVVRPDGRPFVAYSYLPTEDLRIADCVDSSCESVTTRTVDGTGRTGATPSVALRSDGRPLISYYDITNGDLRLADCANPECSSWSLSTIDADGDSGLLGSIAVGPHGGWSIAYQAGDNVKITDGTFTQVIARGRLSLAGMSLRFGRSGLPIIAMYSVNDLLFVRCTSPTCSSFESHSLPSVEQETADLSMTIGPDGMPLVPFFRQPPAGLYVAHCRDEACKYIVEPPRKTPADVDGDGKSDILWRQVGGALSLWQMNGTEIHTSAPLPPMSETWSVSALADFGGDKKADILWRIPRQGSTQVWFMDGPSVIDARETSSQVNNHWGVVGVGDFDGDDKADILWRHKWGTLALWLMDGTTLKASRYLPGAMRAWNVNAVGDFNGDGNTDILWRHANSGKTHIWLMSGAFVLGAGDTTSQADKNWTIQGVGDFEGDGSYDILWRHTLGTLALWQMQGTVVRASSNLPSISTAWTVNSLGDFNGDRKSDILWRKRVSGRTCIWLMNGNQLVGGGLTGTQMDGTWIIQPRTGATAGSATRRLSGAASGEAPCLPN